MTLKNVGEEEIKTEISTEQSLEEDVEPKAIAQDLEYLSDEDERYLVSVFDDGYVTISNGKETVHQHISMLKKRYKCGAELYQFVFDNYDKVVREWNKKKAGA